MEFHRAFAPFGEVIKSGDKGGETSPHDCGAGFEAAFSRCSPLRHSPGIE